MKPASIPEIRKEIKQRDPDEILQICLRLARFKKENKELLTYLLFDASDEQAYVASIKEEIDDMMEGINTNSIYYVKKSFQKIQRSLNKYIRYSGNKQTEIEVLIHFCKAIKTSRLPIHRSSVIMNMYGRSLEKIKKALNSLHEDVQLDYQDEVEKL